MGNVFVHDGVYGINDLVICELKEHKLYIPYYENADSKGLKWFSMGEGFIEKSVNDNGRTKITIRCRYIETKAYKASYHVSTDEYISFYKNDNNELVMEFDNIEFGKISSKYPNKKYHKYYISENVTKGSIFSRLKHHCFTLSMYVNQKVEEHKKYDALNLYQLIERDAKE